MHGTIRERPDGGIEVGQQVWELCRQARHVSTEGIAELDAKASAAALVRTAAKLNTTRLRVS